ncbi:MAG: hypothetical protein HN368_05770 [Spirochaetales bacterium]|jgi:hypothetical protein|nr:hypothetical protein [Spirochaetales bacterium]
MAVLVMRANILEAAEEVRPPRKVRRRVSILSRIANFMEPAEFHGNSSGGDSLRRSMISHQGRISSVETRLQ